MKNMRAEFIKKERKVAVERIVTKKRKAFMLADKWIQTAKAAEKTEVSGYLSRATGLLEVEVNFFSPPTSSTFVQIAEKFLADKEVASNIGVDINVDALPELVRRAADKIGVRRIEQRERGLAVDHEGHERVARREIVRLRRLGARYQQIAQTTGLTLGFVAVVLKDVRLYGEETAVQMTSKRKGKPALLNHGHFSYIRSVIGFHAGETTVREVHSAIVNSFPEVRECSVTTIWRAIKKQMMFTKKLAAVRDKRIFRVGRRGEIRSYLARFAETIINGPELWSCDECAIWIGKRDKRRWCEKGHRVVNTSGSRALQKVTLLLAISTEGRYLAQLIVGNAATTIFASFLLALNDYCDQARLAVQLDNASFHKTSLSLAAAAYTSTEIIFLPPYFPEGNGVEMVFAFIKKKMYTMNATTIQDTMKAVNIILASMSPAMVKAYIRGSFEATLKESS